MDRNCRLTAYAPDRPVALRKESVDRNSSGAKADSVSKVALRKESVDRNVSPLIVWDAQVSRSPQGERG